MKHQSLLRPLLATGEWRADSLRSSPFRLFLFLLLLFIPISWSFDFALTNTVDPALYVCIYFFTYTVSTRRSRAKERKRDRSKKEHRHVPVCRYVRAKREGPEIKHEKSIVEEKRGDVFRPNYVPPLTACCCRGCCNGNCTAGRAVNARRGH